MKTSKSINMSETNQHTMSFSFLWKKFKESDRNNNRQYRLYRKGVVRLTDDNANTLLIAIVFELAELILETNYNIPCENMSDENNSFDDEDQDRFNDMYKEIEEKIFKMQQR